MWGEFKSILFLCEVILPLVCATCVEDLFRESRTKVGFIIEGTEKICLQEFNGDQCNKGNLMDEDISERSRSIFMNIAYSLYCSNLSRVNTFRH